MINKKCPLCGSTKYKIVEQYGEIDSTAYDCRIVCCNSCNHYFTEIASDIDIKALYSSGQYTVIDTRESLIDKILFFDDLLIIKKLSLLNVSERTLLDFGCGKGRFIKNASKYSWKVKGIETAKERADFGINEYGLSISTSEYKTGLIESGPFNVITMFHVLEHLSNPKELISELIENNLTQNGFIVIEVPLFGSLQSRIAKNRWLHLDPPHHLSHFTKTKLFGLLDELKLRPVMYEYLSIHLGMLGMVQSFMNFFGYNKMIISELKFRRTKRLIFLVLLTLPAAFFFEILASLSKNGGVIRVYCKRIYSS